MQLRIKFWNLLMIAALLAGAVFVTPAKPVQAANPLRISQVYGGGGNSGALLTNDFIEVFNGGTTAASLAGFSVQYASTTGSSWQVTNLSGTLQPGQYYLVQEAAGTGGTQSLPTPDAIGTIPMAGGAGKVALVNTTTALTGTCPTTGILDLVAYGTGANCVETSPTGTNLTSTTAAIRLVGGCTDTDNNLADFAVGTPNPRNTASPFNVCAAPDVPPTVSSVTPANGAIDVALNANLAVTFSEPVTVSDPWFSISCATSGTHTAVVSGGPAAFTLNPDADFVNDETCTVTLDATKIVDQDGTPNQMVSNYTFSFNTQTAVCGAAGTPISAIQGSGATSPLLGSRTVKGIVTADFQGISGGFYLQSLPENADANPQTSEGLYVYNNTVAASVGDVLYLGGTVSEYNGLTELGSVSLLSTCATGQALPAPVVLDLPDVADPAFSLEPYEGMLVTIPETLTVQQNYFQGRYGQVTLGAGGRIAQINNLTKGGGSAFDYTRMIVLDDGSSAQNRNPIPYYYIDGEFRAGDTTAGLVGVLDQGLINSTSGTVFPYNYYRLNPTVEPVFTMVNPRPATAPAVGGRLIISGANVENYFTTLDMAPFRSTPPYDGAGNTPRGADSAVEFTRQQAKLVATLAGVHADVFGLTEIEAWDGANGGKGAGQALVDALNAVVGAGTYAVVADPTTGYFNVGVNGDYIQTEIIYDTTTVEPVGAALSSNDTIFDRSPFAQEFRELSSGETFVVVVNHFKSKGSCPASGADADQGDGQGCWNAKRTQQATALLSFITTSLLPMDSDVILVGDYNAYGAEDPINTLTVGGMINQMALHVPAVERYSYVFDGTAGYLDHGLSTPSASPQITGAAFWHINADEPSVIDFNTEFKAPLLCSGVPCSPDLYTPAAYRSSDHDPVLLGLALTPDVVYVDDDWTGLADGTTVTVNTVDYTIGTDAFATVQGGIDGVDAGGTVIVRDGTYYGGLNILKALTLRSENGPETTIIHGGLTTPAIYVISIRASNVTVDGFTVTNPLYNEPGGDTAGIVAAYYGDPVISNITITNNIVTQIGAETRLLTDAGWAATGIVSPGTVNGMEISWNDVYDIHHTNTGVGNTNSPVAIGVYGESDLKFTTNVSVHDNLIYDISAINTNGATGAGFGIANGWASGDAEIFNNVIHDVAGRGVSTSSYNYGTVAVHDNDIYNVGQSAVYFNNALGGSIVSNNIHDNLADGITVNTGVTTAPAIHHNRFYNNASGLNNLTTLSVTAENNWWGCNAGPADAKCDSFTGTVDADPWLVMSVSGAPATLLPGAQFTLTSDLTVNSAAADTTASGYLPEWVLVDYSPAAYVNPASAPVVLGLATSEVTLPVTPATFDLCAKLDAEAFCSSVSVAQPLVTWADDDWTALLPGATVTVDGGSHVIGYDAFATIQGAVDAVISGGLTHVMPGTYVENVVVGKPVEIAGRDQATVIVYPAISDPNCGGVGGGSLCAGTSNVFLVQASNVTIHNLTIDGDNPALTSGEVRGGADLDARNGIITNHALGVFNNLVVHDVTIKNIYLRGIYASSGGSFNFNHNTVQNVRGSNQSIALFNFGGAGSFDHNTVSYANDGIASNWSTGTSYTYNTVTNSESGMHTDNNSGTADLIQFNTISDCAGTWPYGIFVFGSYVNVSVDQNTITNCKGTTSGSGAALTIARPNDASVLPTFTNNIISNSGMGLYATTGNDWGWGAVNTTLTASGNVITGNDIGVYFEADNTFTLTANLTGNSIAGNTVAATTGRAGASYQGTYTINAAGNWWGSNDPAVILAAIEDAPTPRLIDFTPWLNSGTDTDAVAPGFQGDFSYLNVGLESPQTGTVGRIQEGVNLTSGTVYLWPGTYEEQVKVVGKNDLTLLGADQATTIIKSPATLTALYGDRKPVVGVELSENVTIKNLTVDGAGRGNANTRFFGVFFHNASGLIDNLLVTAVRNTPLDGVQSGVAIYTYNDDGTPRSVTATNNTVIDYQKGGLVFNGTGLTTVAKNNTATGMGPTGLTAQNGIQFGFGSTGTLEGNTISGHWYTGDPTWSAAGVLLYQAADVTVKNNTITANQQGIAVSEASNNVAILSNTLMSNDFGVDIVTSTGATASYNRIVDNVTAGIRTDTAAVAENNWWGCNEGTTGVDCDPVAGTVDADPWLVLTVGANPASVLPGATSAVTADLILNSAAANTSAGGFVPDGILAAFTAPDGGTILPATSLTANGAASSVFTAPAPATAYQVCAAVDHETICSSITVQNVAPVAVNDTYTTAEDTTLTVPAPGVLANDTDANGDPLTAVLVSDVTAAQGVLTFNADGSFTFVPALNFNGDVTFTYKANDGSLDSNVATVTITVTPVHDAPLAVDDYYTTMANVTLDVAAPGVMANDVDVDVNNRAVSLLVAAEHGMVSLRTDGSFTYIPDSTFYGQDKFQYELVTYPNGVKAPWTANAWVYITVNPYQLWLPIISR